MELVLTLHLQPSMWSEAVVGNRFRGVRDRVHGRRLVRLDPLVSALTVGRAHSGRVGHHRHTALRGLVSTCSGFLMIGVVPLSLFRS